MLPGETEQKYELSFPHWQFWVHLRNLEPFLKSVKAVFVLTVLHRVHGALQLPCPKKATLRYQCGRPDQDGRWSFLLVSSGSKMLTFPSKKSGVYQMKMTSVPCRVLVVCISTVKLSSFLLRGEGSSTDTGEPPDSDTKVKY